MMGGEPCAPEDVCALVWRAGSSASASTPLLAGDVDDGSRDGVPAVGIAAAGADGGADLTTDPSERGLVQEVGGRRLADLQGGPVGEQCGRDLIRGRGRGCCRTARCSGRSTACEPGPATAPAPNRCSHRGSTTTRSPWSPRCCPLHRPPERRRPSRRPRRGRSARPGSSPVSRHPRARR